MINVHDSSSHHPNPHHTIGSNGGGGNSQSLAHSLSLKRLKTPKIKAKDELHTPPMERNGIL
jgi:hypothetical protein